MPPRDRIRAGFVKSETPSSASFAQQRREWEDAVSATPLPAGVTAKKIAMDGVPGLLVVPASSDFAALLIHFHGGGFTAGSSITHRALAAQLALASGAAVLLVDYRLAPEAPFPAARDDGIAAYRWARRAGYPPASIAIGGDSAGAHVALSAILALRDAGDSLPAGVVLLSPWLDLSQGGESMKTLAAADPLVTPSGLARAAAAYLGGRKPGDPAVAILHASLRDLPPTLLHVGSDEILLSDAERLAAQARVAGVAVTLKVWPGLWHVFHAWAPELPEALTALGDIGRHLRQHLRPPGEAPFC